MHWFPLEFSYLVFSAGLLTILSAVSCVTFFAVSASFCREYFVFLALIIIIIIIVVVVVVDDVGIYIDTDIYPFNVFKEFWYAEKPRVVQCQSEDCRASQTESQNVCYITSSTYGIIL
jgi:Na+/proline symporter